jgi:hypothetical protein
MAHYAFLNENNIVTQVIVGNDEGATDMEQFYSNFVGLPCKRTSYNTSGGVHLLGGVPFRKNYAGIGFTYDGTRDAFIPPQPYPSWVLNEETCLWEAPEPMPDDGLDYEWDEQALQWV